MYVEPNWAQAWDLMSSTGVVAGKGVVGSRISVLQLLPRRVQQQLLLDMTYTAYLELHHWNGDKQPGSQGSSPACSLPRSVSDILISCITYLSLLGRYTSHKPSSLGTYIPYIGEQKERDTTRRGYFATGYLLTLGT